MNEADNWYTEDGAAPTSSPQLNLADVALHAITRFPLTIVACVALGAIGAVVYGLSKPNEFTSVAMLLVRLGAREQRTPETSLTEEYRGPTTGVAVWDELLILQNPELHERVVDEVGVARILRPYDPAWRDVPETPARVRWLHRLQAWLMGYDREAAEAPLPMGEGAVAAAVARVSQSITIVPQARTSTLLVSYTANDPDHARSMASAYLKVFQARHREIYETSNELSFINRQLEAAQKSYEDAEQALREQGHEDGIHNLQALIDDLAEEIQGLENLNLQEQILGETLARQLEVVKTQIEPYADDLEQPEPTTPEPQVRRPTYRYASLVTQLETANTELARLVETYAPGSTILEQESARLEARIEVIRGELAEIEAADVVPPAAPPRQPNLVLAELLGQQLSIIQRQQALKAGIDARELAIAAHKERLDELITLRPVYAHLERNVSAARDRAEQLARAHRQAEILELIDADERMSNLIVTQEPSLPARKDGPDRGQFVMLGTLAGLFVGLAQAALRVLLDSRLRYPRNVEAALGIHVLGVVPERRAWRRHGRRIRRSMGVTEGARA